MKLHRLILLVSLVFAGNVTFATFLEEQLKYSRVREAWKEKESVITEKLSNFNLTTSGYHAMIKAYKYEEKFRLFIKPKSAKKWQVYEEFPFCSFSGDLGPKREQGDYQIPEGYYHLNHFNPYSTFFLSLGVSYPNKSDRIKSTARDKGGAIYIHGDCVTIGCIPLTDDKIKEIYMVCVLAKNNGQSQIPIQIFPFDYTERKFESACEHYPQHKDFWTNLYIPEKEFLKDSVNRKVGINATTGDYYLID